MIISIYYILLFEGGMFCCFYQEINYEMVGLEGDYPDFTKSYALPLWYGFCYGGLSFLSFEVIMLEELEYPLESGRLGLYKGRKLTTFRQGQ